MKLLSAVLLLIAPVSLRAVTVYSDNFEGGVVAPVWSGAGNLQPTGGLSGFGFGNAHLHNPGNTATLLNLIGIGPHESITLTFDLAMWDSIDIGGDQFVVQAGGLDLYNSSTDFGNYSPADNVSHGPGNLLTAPFSDFTTPNYGQSTSFRDSARHVSFTFAHTGESLTVSWSYPNSQTAPDESFGLDNVSVDANVIPEPATGFLACAVFAFAACRRRVRGTR